MLSCVEWLEWGDVVLPLHHNPSSRALAQSCQWLAHNPDKGSNLG